MTKKTNNPEVKYQLTVTEDQLRLIANCVEDVCRFMAGQVELWNATSNLPTYCEPRDKLEEVKPLITPNLPDNASYGWSGGGCDNEYQRKFIAKAYCVYRKILHQMKIQDKNNTEWNVYDSPTLTCKDDGPLPIIKKMESNK